VLPKPLIWLNSKWRGVELASLKKRVRHTCSDANINAVFLYCRPERAVVCLQVCAARQTLRMKVKRVQRWLKRSAGRQPSLKWAMIADRSVSWEEACISFFFWTNLNVNGWISQILWSLYHSLLQNLRTVLMFYIFINSIKFKFICIALFTIHIVLKQLYRKCILEMYMEKKTFS